MDDLGTHLLQCPCESEHTTTHNTFWDIVVAIALENKTHVQREVSHLFLVTFNDKWIFLLLKMAFVF
jgi:hypothetical protein